MSGQALCRVSLEIADYAYVLEDGAIAANFF